MKLVIETTASAAIGILIALAICYGIDNLLTTF